MSKACINKENSSKRKLSKYILKGKSPVGKVRYNDGKKEQLIITMMIKNFVICILLE